MNEPAAREGAPRELTLHEVRKRVTQIWELCLERENIGAKDNFFDLGGNSISAMYIAAMLNEAFSADIPFQRVLELNDVASTAEYLFRHARTAGDGRTKIRIGATP